MNIKNNTVLITGGATGIGFALAQAFVNTGNKVIICGRREDKLREAQTKIPQIQYKVCNVSEEKERESLFCWVRDNFEDINVLINNAGISREINFKKGIKELVKNQNEIATNLLAPIHLCSYFIPLLLEKKEAAIFNVTSGLAYIPMAISPVYCAAKAGLHSFTLSLREQLKDSSVKVFEIVPPLVETELSAWLIEKGDQASILPGELARITLAAMSGDEYDILVGKARNIVRGAREDPEKWFRIVNQF